jgi:hypothetical protein
LLIVKDPTSVKSAMELACDTLADCDRIRSELLSNHNIMIRDGEGEFSSMWQYCDAGEATATEQESPTRSKSLVVDPCIRPEDMYRVLVNEYSAFDHEGIPTHDANNEALSKSLRKKLSKRMLRYAERFHSSLKDPKEPSS